MRSCSFPGCGRKHKSRGLCISHHRQRTDGLPLTPIVGNTDRSSKSAITSRFLTRVEITSTCWLWTGSLNRLGYGQCSGPLYGSTKAHRASYLLFNGDIPDGLCVMHLCDVRNCVNPKHLVVGTQAENVADMIQKGRCRRVGKRGSASHFAKLTESEVREIRQKCAGGNTQISLAVEYSVSPMTISRLIRRESWSHVE